jgi:hypothetical protein
MSGFSLHENKTAINVFHVLVFRDGEFGACFFLEPKSKYPVIYCARPGSRMWEVQCFFTYLSFYVRICTIFFNFQRLFHFFFFGGGAGGGKWAAGIGGIDLDAKLCHHQFEAAGIVFKQENAL